MLGEVERYWPFSVRGWTFVGMVCNVMVVPQLSEKLAALTATLAIQPALADLTTNSYIQMLQLVVCQKRNAGKIHVLLTGYA